MQGHIVIIVATRSTGHPFCTVVIIHTSSPVGTASRNWHKWWDSLHILSLAYLIVNAIVVGNVVVHLRLLPVEGDSISILEVFLKSGNPVSVGENETSFYASVQTILVQRMSQCPPPGTSDGVSETPVRTERTVGEAPIAHQENDGPHGGPS